MRPRRAPILAVVAALACVPAGCGGTNTLTAGQLQSRATRICDTAAVKMGTIAAPRLPADEEAFLTAGISALSPEVAQLGRLAPPSGTSAQYIRARAMLSAQLRVLRAAVVRLHAGADPLNEIKTLETKLEPIEATANTLWNEIGIPACADH